MMISINAILIILLVSFFPISIFGLIMTFSLKRQLLKISHLLINAPAVVVPPSISKLVPVPHVLKAGLDSNIYNVSFGIDWGRGKKEAQLHHHTSQSHKKNILPPIKNENENEIYDAVTKLPSQTLFCDHLKMELAHTKKGYKVFVITVKLTDYISIFNRFGDAFCKSLLNTTRLKLKRFLSDTATLARLNEEEFGIIESIYFKQAQVEEICKKIVNYFDRSLQIDNVEVISRVAIGISNFPEDGSTQSILIENAQKAQEKAASDLSRFAFYKLRMDVPTEAKSSLLLDLQSALADQEFFVFYQPQVSLSTGDQVGAEALIRWKHPEFGLVPPLTFLPVAESSGLIVPIGNWVIETVFRDLKNWRKYNSNRWATTKIAINLSSIQFMQKTLVQDVNTLLIKYDLPPENIEFEITESILIHDLDEVIAQMKKLREHRLSLSMDDFGTGYSSLSCLTNLPIQKLKIDKTFIDDMEHYEASLVMVKSIIELGHNLGFQVLAEGVENKAQLEILKKLNCDLIQGYYFSRPISAENFSTFAVDKRGATGFILPS